MPQRWKSGDRIECDLAFCARSLDVAEEGYVAGYASTPSTDLMGHKILPGAFDKSIARNGLKGPRSVKLLAQHKSHQPAGLIKRLETIDDNLEIEAQLNLNVSYVRDLYEISKQVGGLNFSVGFELEDFEFVDEKKAKDSEYLVIKQGNLIEVSVVTFPAQPEATMSYIKSYETMTELEKALVAEEFCQCRSEAHKLVRFLRANEHLFLGEPAPSAGPADQASHPVLDVRLLQACTDLAAQANRSLR